MLSDISHAWVKEYQRCIRTNTKFCAKLIGEFCGAHDKKARVTMEPLQYDADGNKIGLFLGRSTCSRLRVVLAHP